MRCLFFTSILFISFLLISCAGSSNIVSVVTSPTYEDQKLTDVNILACINPKNITYENKLFIKELGEGDPDSVYLSFFQNMFSNTIRRYSFERNVVFEKCTFDSIYEIKKIDPSDNNSQSVHIPRKGFEHNKDSIQFLIVIDSMRIYRGSNLGFMPGVMLYSQDSFSHECKFFIWDNSKHEVVSYGLISGREPMMTAFSISKTVWNNSLIKMTREIMRTTPFYNWKGK